LPWRAAPRLAAVNTLAGKHDSVGKVRQALVKSPHAKIMPK